MNQDYMPMKVRPDPPEGLTYKQQAEWARDWEKNESGPDWILMLEKADVNLYDRLINDRLPRVLISGAIHLMKSKYKELRNPRIFDPYHW